MVDLTQASQFLELLDRDGEFTFQTFVDSSEASGSARFPRVLHGSLEKHGDQLMQLNAHGAGIFVMVNAGDGVVRPGATTCRTCENVTAVRTVFVDLDGAPIAPVLDGAIPPDWVVQSSPDRWHAYWHVQDCPLDQFTALQTALAVRYDGDRTVKDLARVMRLPGFVHRKSTPFVSGLYLPEAFDTIRRSAA